MKLFLTAILISLPVSIIRADDNSARNFYNDAIHAYDQRVDSKKLDEGLALLQKAHGESPATGTKYEILILESKFLYTKGTRVNDDAEKIRIHLEGKTKADEAIALYPEDKNFADGYFWSAANLGRWAMANGPVSSVTKKPEMFRLLDGVYKNKVRGSDNLAGNTYEGFGADRIKGRVYDKLPAISGGSTVRALQHLEKAYAGAPNHSLNVIYYAEALYTSKEEKNKQKAKDILDKMLALDPETLNKERVPETKEEFEEARKLRATMK